MKKIYRPRVSQHARDRFRERFFDADCAQEVCDKMASAFILQPEVRAYLSWGVCGIFNFNGMHIYARNGNVTTVTPADWERRSTANHVDRPEYGA